MDAELLGLATFFGFAIGLGLWVVLVAMMDINSEVREPDELFAEGPMFRLMIPYVQYFGRMVKPFKGLDKSRRDIHLKLTRAGKAMSLTPDDFIGMQIVSGIIGLSVGLYFVFMLGLGLEISLGFGMLGFIFPLLQIKEQIKKRQHQILKILPYTLDLLCLSVEAGLDFGAALNKITEKLADNPFRDEIRLLSRDITMGKTRAQALRDLDHRVGLDDLREVTTALIQADELGASLGPTLRIQSAELQRKRFQRAEKKAMQAPVLMLIPLVMFIFPVTFLMIFTPIVLKVMGMDVMSKFQ